MSDGFQDLEPFLDEVLSYRTKDILINELYHYFQNVSTLGNINDPIKMPKITETFALDIREYPLITIHVTSENTINAGIGQDYCEDVWSDDQQVGQVFLPGTEGFARPVPYRPRVIAERWIVFSDITFSIKVYGDTNVIRNRVAAETIKALKRFSRKRLLDRGIVVLFCNMGDETTVAINESQKLYIANISLVVNAECYVDKPVPYITGVNVIPQTTIVEPYSGYIIQNSEQI